MTRRRAARVQGSASRLGRGTGEDVEIALQRCLCRPVVVGSHTKSRRTSRTRQISRKRATERRCRGSSRVRSMSSSVRARDRSAICGLRERHLRVRLTSLPTFPSCSARVNVRHRPSDIPRCVLSVTDAPTRSPGRQSCPASRHRPRREIGSRRTGED